MEGFENVGPPIDNSGPVFDRGATNLLAIDVEGNNLFCNPGNLKACMHACKTLEPGYERSCADAISATYAPVPLCFPGSQRIFTLNRGKVEMREISVGDVVMDAALAPTPVVGFLHQDLEISAEYLSFALPGLPTLEISADHLVYTGNFFLPAGQAKTLAAVACDGSVVPVSVAKNGPDVVLRQGAFAPLTASGSLVVGSFVCSCYALPGRLGNFFSHAAANAALWPARAGFISFDFHSVEEYVHMLCELAELAE